MRVTAQWDFARAQVVSTRPVLAMLLATGAGVTAFTSPLNGVATGPDSPSHPPLAARAAEFRVDAVATPVQPLRPSRQPGEVALPGWAMVTEGQAIAAATQAFRPALASPAASADRSALERDPLVRAEAEKPALVEVKAVEPPPVGAVQPLAALSEPPARPPAEELVPARPETLVAPALAASAPRRPEIAASAPMTTATPPVETRPVHMMPAAELKAMMAAEVARRGSTPFFQERPATPRAATTAPTPVRVSPRRSAASGTGMTPRAIRPAPSAAVPATAQVASSSSAERSDAAISRYSQTAEGIAFDVAAQVNGESAGKVPMLINGEDTISVRLGDIVALLEPLMDRPLYAVLSESRGAGEYVTLNRLRAAGIAVRFDKQDRLILGTN